MNKLLKNAKYVISKDNIIYKVIRNKDYLLKVSPWNIGEDRRLFLSGDDNSFEKISFAKAREIINRQWDTDEREWEFEGNTYKVYNSLENEFKTTYNKAQNIKEHFFTNIIGRTGFPVKYYICMFQGKLYWVLLNSYYPQAQLYNFIDINTKPDKFAQWANAKHCKIVYKLVYKNNINQYESI